MSLVSPWMIVLVAALVAPLMILRAYRLQREISERQAERQARAKARAEATQDEDAAGHTAPPDYIGGKYAEWILH